jgi:hypothetical protein
MTGPPGHVHGNPGRGWSFPKALCPTRIVVTVCGSRLYNPNFCRRSAVTTSVDHGSAHGLLHHHPGHRNNGKSSSATPFHGLPISRLDNRFNFDSV